MTESTSSLTDEQRRWVEQAASRVTAMARRLAPKLPHASIDELESAGYEGLVQAALRYDPTAGVPFRAYAHYRIRGAMIDTARDNAPVIRRRSRAIRALQASQALLEHAQKKAPSAEAADRRSLAERVAAAADLVAKQTTAVILSKAAPRDPDTVEAPDADVEATLLHSELREQLQAVLGECNEEERALIDALYFRGQTMHAYASHIGKSVATVSRHHARLIARMSESLEARFAARRGSHQT